MYKRVLIINNRVYAVANDELGLKPTAECHKCLVEDCKDFEVIDGDSIDRPWDGTLICWWERKRLIPISALEAIA